MSIKKVLIVDDEPLIRNFLKDSLARLNKDIHQAENGEEAISKIQQDNFDLIITDMKMPKKNGLDVLKYARKKNPSALVILITAFASLDTAIDSLNEGAFNYLIKPFSIDSLEAALKKAEEYKYLLQENTYLRNEITYPKNFQIIAKSLPMKNIINTIDKIAVSNASVFISGESGTGKEVIAQLIHFRSKRASNPFIKVNCAAIPDTLIESEFFGHEKGSFTGAFDQKKGRFELANKGTLLLDEITEIPSNLQAKLLRALQEKEFERIGGTKPISTDTRFISTSNKNIQEAIKENEFREDLFYRLNVVPIHLPPLRERKEDIPILSYFFLDKFVKENHKKLKIFTDEAIEALIDHSWPGNVRELANIIERTVVMDKADKITKEHLGLDLNTSISKDSLIGKSVEEVERMLILKTLKNQNYNKTKTAKVLKISLRTLRNKLNSYNFG